jgi:hypothetical protein
MVLELELRVQHGSDWSALAPVMRVFFTYVLSFIFLGTYWNNHHHMLHATNQGRGALGESASAVLAVAHAVRHRLDGRERVRAPDAPNLSAAISHCDDSSIFSRRLTRVDSTARTPKAPERAQDGRR